MKKVILSLLSGWVALCFASLSFAEVKAAYATITNVNVNGGQDTENPGTTCIQVSSAVSASCPSGHVAIPKNNSQLISAALAAKASNANIWLYYADSSLSNTYHCPGLAFTPCSVISIGIR